MSQPKYFTYKGYGEYLRDNYWYNQAVRIGNRIETAGQGGWDSNGKIPTDLKQEIDNAFANVDLALKTAGGKGWSQVYKVTVYLVDVIQNEGMDPLVDAFKKWLPDHKPVNTVLGVKELALKEMRIEIDVVAQIGEE